jgi:hypothetical protein
MVALEVCQALSMDCLSLWQALPLCPGASIPVHVYTCLFSFLPLWEWGWGVSVAAEVFCKCLFLHLGPADDLKLLWTEGPDKIGVEVT